MEQLPFHQAEEKPRNLPGWLRSASASPKEAGIKDSIQLYLERENQICWATRQEKIGGDGP